MFHFSKTQSNYQRSPLASKLLRIVLSFYLFVALCITGFQLVLEYQNEKNRLVELVLELVE